ncbi:MAG: hypothetical protein QF886_04895, partial [Planctomycetota bacterium]|nr:hypothetical protein [Planctomycetota bacterium]
MTARTHSANQNVWHAGATFSSLLFTIISVSISTGLCGEMAAARVKDIRPGAESSMRRSSDAHMQHV